jgi:DNA-binding NtrC family response regulator
VATGGIATTPHARVDENAVVVEVGTTVDEAERQLILKTLTSTNNNKTRAAEILGITTKTLQNKLKEYASAEAAATASNAAGSSSVPDPAAVGAE